MTVRLSLPLKRSDQLFLAAVVPASYRLQKAVDAYR